MITISEVERDQPLDEALLKKMSGNDEIIARFMYGSESPIHPRWQTIIQCNDRPKFDATDSGMQRRMMEVPFDNVMSKDPVIGGDNFNPRIKEERKKDAAFKEGILAWMVEGAVEYHRQGRIPLCGTIEHATKLLLSKNDVVSRFLGEMCVVHEKGEGFGYPPVRRVRPLQHGWQHDPF